MQPLPNALLKHHSAVYWLLPAPITRDCWFLQTVPLVIMKCLVPAADRWTASLFYSGSRNGQWIAMCRIHNNPSNYAVQLSPKSGTNNQHPGRWGMHTGNAACLACHPQEKLQELPSTTAMPLLLTGHIGVDCIRVIPMATRTPLPCASELSMVIPVQVRIPNHVALNMPTDCAMQCTMTGWSVPSDSQPILIL